MATERLPMRHIREILRLKWQLKRSHRETARSLGISAGAVASVISRARGVGTGSGTHSVRISRCGARRPGRFRNSLAITI
jgi:hypothetical protein